MAVGVEELELRFTPYQPGPEQGDRMSSIRAACLTLACEIDALAPDSREKADTLTNLDYVMYQANAAIARRER